MYKYNGVKNNERATKPSLSRGLVNPKSLKEAGDKGAYQPASYIRHGNKQIINPPNPLESIINSSLGDLASINY